MILNVAIVGCGKIADSHVSEIRKLRCARLVAVCDLESIIAEQLAVRYAVVLRPGVIYGPGGGHFSGRVGITMGSWQLYLGGSNLLPLTYVENCAEAVVTAGIHADAAGQVYNVHDDDLPTCREYLRAYKKYVRNIRSVPLPYFATRLLSKTLVGYHRYWKGQLPAVLTPYKVASLWAGRFDNSKLHSIGWQQSVPTAEGIRSSFTAFRAEPDTAQ